MEPRQLETVIVGGRALLPDGALAETEITLRDGRIAALGVAPGATARPAHLTAVHGATKSR